LAGRGEDARSISRTLLTIVSVPPALDVIGVVRELARIVKALDDGDATGGGMMPTASAVAGKE
jgi:hypothetical protein